MSNLLQIADAVRTGAERLKWIGELAAALERIGSIEQAEAEAKTRLEFLRASVEQSEGAVAEARERLVAIQGEGAKILKDASDQAAGFLREAQDEAKAELEKAQKAGDALLARTRSEADLVRQEAQNLRESARSAADSARSALESSEKVLAQRRRELAELDRKLDEARTQARKIIGG